MLKRKRQKYHDPTQLLRHVEESEKSKFFYYLLVMGVRFEVIDWRTKRQSVIGLGCSNVFVLSDTIVLLFTRRNDLWCLFSPSLLNLVTVIVYFYWIDYRVTYVC